MYNKQGKWMFRCALVSEALGSLQLPNNEDDQQETMKCIKRRFSLITEEALWQTVELLKPQSLSQPVRPLLNRNTTFIFHDRDRYVTFLSQLLQATPDDFFIISFINMTLIPCSSVNEFEQYTLNKFKSKIAHLHGTHFGAIYPMALSEEDQLAQAVQKSLETVKKDGDKMEMKRIQDELSKVQDQLARMKTHQISMLQEQIDQMNDHMVLMDVRLAKLKQLEPTDEVSEAMCLQLKVMEIKQPLIKNDSIPPLEVEQNIEMPSTQKRENDNKKKKNKRKRDRERDEQVSERKRKRKKMNIKKEQLN